MTNNIRAFKKMRPQLGERVMVDSSSVLIGDIQLDDDVSIWPLVAIRGDVNQITIGKRSNIQDGCVLHVTHKSSQHPSGDALHIGDDVTVGHKVLLHGCTIGDRVLVGMGSIILDGAVVDNDTLIGAGSLVPQGKHLVGGYLYFGSPVKQIRQLTEEERAKLVASAANYVKLKQAVLSGE
ncbi:MAG: Protein YrdA [Candidatus Erwinia impunctatus]|nr:Protein YrdA [Culicoides impunctatus]